MTTILIVDDDAMIRRVLAEALELEGYRAIQAGNGEEALARLRVIRPEVVLLDMQMPVVDGRAFAERYAATVGPRAPIVCMTAARDAATCAAEIGADAHLPKPFGLQEVLNIIERFAGPPPIAPTPERSAA